MAAFLPNFIQLKINIGQLKFVGANTHVLLFVSGSFAKPKVAFTRATTGPTTTTTQRFIKRSYTCAPSVAKATT